VVTLRGIKISLYPPPAVRGIVFSSGGALYVENCVVEGPNEGIDIFPFGFTGDVRVFIRDTVTSNSGDGIRVLRHTASSVLVQIERSSMEGNYVGLNVGDGAAATARSCVMVRNRIQGVGVGGATGTFPPRPTELTIEDGLISGNDTGIGANNTNVTVRVSHCTITDNQFGLSGFGGPFAVQVLTRGNNTLEANTINGTFTGVYTAK